MTDEDPEKAYAAYERMMDRWLDACLILDKTDSPQWKRWQRALKLPT